MGAFVCGLLELVKNFPFFCFFSSTMPYYSAFRLLVPLVAVVIMAEATPPGIANHPSHATCKIKKYKHCYNLVHVCPKFCPHQCTVECASCKPICDGDANPPPEADPTPATPSPPEADPTPATPSPPEADPTPATPSPPEADPTPATPSPPSPSSETYYSPPPPVAVTPTPPSSTPTPPYSPTPVALPRSPPPPTNTNPPSTPPTNPNPPSTPPANPNPPSTPPENPNPPTPSTPNSPSPSWPPPTPSEAPSSPTTKTPPPASPAPSQPDSPPRPPPTGVSGKSPSSSAGGAKRVRCKNVNYPQCYNMIHTCPNACSGGCEVDCVTCKPVCHCDRTGAVCQDPRFIGGDGITFYFHGKKDRDFCLVSDPNLHINAHFIGKRNPSLKRDFTWVQSLGILFQAHRLFIAAQKTAVWDDSADRLTIALDGRPVTLPESGGSQWQHPTVVVARLAPVNHVMVEVKGLFRITAKVVPITEEDSRIHNYGVTEEDSMAHLDVGFKFFGLSGEVNGVLGQTYGGGYVSSVNVKAAMAVMGREEEFETSSLFSPDCAVARFGGGDDGGHEEVA